MYTTYGYGDIPALNKSAGRDKCPFCPDNTKNKKGDTTVCLAINAGPVGRVYYCKTHAKQLAKEILQLLQPTRWIIQSTTNSQLYWSTQQGWVCVGSIFDSDDSNEPTTFDSDDSNKPFNHLPTGGKWVKLD